MTRDKARYNVRKTRAKELRKLFHTVVLLQTFVFVCAVTVTEKENENETTAVGDSVEALRFEM